MSSDSNFQNAVNIFNDIKKSLDTNKSLQWNLSVESLKCAWSFIETPAAQQFIDECLVKLLTLMMQQSPAKLGIPEKTAVEDAILITLKIFLKLLPTNTKYIVILAKVFDPNLPFYHGVKIGFTFAHGFPQIRVQIAQKFAEAKGFTILNTALKKQDFVWPGCEVLLNMAQILNIPEVFIVTDDRDKEEILQSLMAKILAMPDDLIKKENTDTLSQLIRTINIINTKMATKTLQPNALDPFHKFWLENTLKFMNSGSLVMKLFAWEQINDIIFEARHTRPIGVSYLVENAGTDYVNGIYNIVKTDDGSKFTKLPNQAGRPLLTLFRCQMRTKAHYWFISEADIEKPGSEKDIDYYLHKSNRDEEREPPLRGWTRNNSGASLIGKDPAPILKRLSLLLPKNATKEMYLDYKFLEWSTLKLNFINYIFGSSMHREIVSRSGKYLIFLCEYEKLTSAELKSIWKSAMQCPEMDTVEEICAQLIPLSTHLSQNMFSELIDMAMEELTSSEDHLTKILAFTEKFAAEDFKYVNGVLTQTSSAKLLNLVWTIYKHADFENFKNHLLLQELLSTCLYTQNTSQCILDLVNECRSILAGLISVTANASVTTNMVLANPQLSMAYVQQEGIAERIIRILFYFVTKHFEKDLSQRFQNEGLPKTIMAELERFCTANRPRLISEQINEQWFSHQLMYRLQVLRRLYDHNAVVTIPFEIIERLWQLLSSTSKELDEFFSFIKDLIVITSNQDTLRIYKMFLCNPSIDWSKCGESGFDCFRTYFSELEAAGNFFSPETELPPKLGLSTLWDIALNCPSMNSTKRAIELLLQCYDSQISEDGANSDLQRPDSIRSMMDIVFLRLQECQSILDSAGVSDLKEGDLTKISRCISILTSSINKSAINSNQQVTRTNLVNTPHIVRGCMGRLHITVYYRRITGFFNQSTQSDIVRIEKGSEGLVKLDVHPMQTFQHLKEKVCDHGRINPNYTFSVDNMNKTFLNDHTRIAELGLTDGGEISISYQISFQSHKTFDDDLYYRAPEKNKAQNLQRGIHGISGSIINDSTCSILSTNMDSVVPVRSITQILSQDSSFFECLLNLCETLRNLPIAASIWELLMLLPTQIDMFNQIESISNHSAITNAEAANFEIVETDSSRATAAANIWNPILGKSSTTHTTYFLQIIDSYMQPAPELIDEAGIFIAKSRIFQNAFIETGGFSQVLKILISLPSSEKDEICATALAVSLHTIFFLLYQSHSKPEDFINDSDANLSEQLDLSAEPEPVPVNSSVLSDWSMTANALMDEIQQSSGKLIEKLLFVARNAAANEETGVLHNALFLITNLIKTPEVASQLINNVHSKTLLITVLKSGSKKVRDIASDFAVQVGKTQSVVLQWLLDEVRQMNLYDDNCSEIFYSLSTLLKDLYDKNSSLVDLQIIGSIVSNKLLDYPKQVAPIQDERHALLGYLDLLDLLISFDYLAVLKTPLGKNLVEIFFSDFLFTLPTDSYVSAVCDTPASKQAAFDVLTSYVHKSKDGFHQVIVKLDQLATAAAKHIQFTWGLQVSHDIKQSDVHFTGLKNQGCTCYMNSLLQQLFMNVNFRDAILAAPILENHRTTLWHRTTEEIVGETLLFEMYNGSWRAGKVDDYHSETNEHKIIYHKADGSIDECTYFNIHEGRGLQSETGRVKLVIADDVLNTKPATEREEAAYRVLEQLQRVFCFLKLSKKRYMDPKPLVDACKTLNLNFNVYHQNDASEFCDQLLDRVETATKGLHTNEDIWNNVIMKEVFGGKCLYQKIPQECEAYKTDKTTCGHWQSSRSESFLKIELMIRGKEKIDDSLSELMAGELMDKDNKIQCDVCAERKAAVRRTCFGSLPNTLILHLKRFDLDYQTFETVKLNNRMAFPIRINVLKYCKEGVEAEEVRLAHQEIDSNPRDESINDNINVSTKSREVSLDNKDTLQYEVPPPLSDAVTELDPADYEYELQGVLVHSGVAQGGHYYSFIRDPQNANKWYKFDDEDVSSFNPENIPSQCFGGPTSANNSNSSMTTSMMMGSVMEDNDRTSNALMLFYKKVQHSLGDIPSISNITIDASQIQIDVVDTESSLATRKKSGLVDGEEAFRREVHESNIQHILSIYVLDPDLQAFVRGLITSITQIAKEDIEDSDLARAASNVLGMKSENDSKISGFRRLEWSISDTDKDLTLRTVKFGVTFLLDIVMHCRERSAMRAAINVLKEAFATFSYTALWFLNYIIDTRQSNWFQEFLVQCSDPLARATFVQIVVLAAMVVAPDDCFALMPFKTMKLSDLILEASTKNNPAASIALLLSMIIESIFKAVNHLKTSDELFVLVRDLCSIPCICLTLQSSALVSSLSYFIMPEQVPASVRQPFEKYISVRHQNNRPDFTGILQNVFEAMAALLGVPQIRKVNLLQERVYWETELIPEAKEALTTIFSECSKQLRYMDNADLTNYFEKVCGPNANPKSTQVQVRNILDRFSTSMDGKLPLEGFLQHHTEAASYNPKSVWRDLHAFGFRNDLTRSNMNRSINLILPSSNQNRSVEESKGDSASIAAVGWRSGPSSFDSDWLSSVPLFITDTCKSCLANVALYESGMSTSEAAARAIAQRVCLRDENMSCALISQALEKLYSIISDNNWNHHPISVINEFIRLLMSIDDGLQSIRMKEILISKFGLAEIALSEKNLPSECKANEFTKTFLYERYIQLVQDLVVANNAMEIINKLALFEPKIKTIKGLLKLRPGSTLTENEDYILRNTMIVVEGAGITEVNGEYTFKEIRCSAGYYNRFGEYGGKTVRFTLYKCALKTGGFQWFISLTPDGLEPGTLSDIDFYYGPSKTQDQLPGTQWNRITANHTKDPAPTVRCVRIDTDYSSDSEDKEGFDAVVGDETIDEDLSVTTN